MSANTYIKFHRNWEIINWFMCKKSRHKALLLLNIIALRADRYTKEAIISDWETMGFTRSEYRGAQSLLSKLELCSFKKKKGFGTVAILRDNGLFSIN